MIYRKKSILKIKAKSHWETLTSKFEDLTWNYLHLNDRRRQLVLWNMLEFGTVQISTVFLVLLLASFRLFNWSGVLPPRTSNYKSIITFGISLKGHNKIVWCTQNLINFIRTEKNLFRVENTLIFLSYISKRTFSSVCLIKKSISIINCFVVFTI